MFIVFIPGKTIAKRCKKKAAPKKKVASKKGNTKRISWV
jgi:hypothetical protein